MCVVPLHTIFPPKALVPTAPPPHPTVGQDPQIKDFFSSSFSQKIIQKAKSPHFLRIREIWCLQMKGLVLKSFMRQVAIIEAHGVPWKFWIL